MDNKTPTKEPPTPTIPLFYLYGYIFLQSLLANALIRIYVSPYLPGNGAGHFALVLGTRMIVDMIGRAQYYRGMGRKAVDRDPCWFNMLLLLLPGLLVDVGLGGCWFDCELRGWAKGYCAAPVGRFRWSTHTCA